MLAFVFCTVCMFFVHRVLGHVTCVVAGDWSECSVPSLFVVASHTDEILAVDGSDVTEI